jgi:hypothetical protein
MRVKDKVVNGHPDQPENAHADQREDYYILNLRVLDEAMTEGRD